MILLVCHSLSSGGAERVLSRMANHWAAAGRPVTLLTIAPRAHDFYPLDQRVHRIALDLATDSPSPLAALRNNLRRLRTLRQTFRRLRPAVIISFLDRTNVTTILAAMGLSIPVIVSERIDPRRHPIGRAWAALRRLAYPHAHALVIQSPAIRPWAEGMVRAGRIVVIPNPAPSGTEETAVEERVSPCPEPYVVAMGRLDRQKGFDLLLAAFARAAGQHPDWTLLILGEGPERPHLQAQAERLGIAARVSLPGAVKNPAPLLRRAGLFVLSSRYEGFPNALLEAMANGLPVISFDCPTGPGEIITHEVDGLLVPAEDTDALARAMEALLRDHAHRARLSAGAVTAVRRYSTPVIMERWESTIAQASAVAAGGAWSWRRPRPADPGTPAEKSPRNYS